jgi:hypothetical protein
MTPQEADQMAADIFLKMANSQVEEMRGILAQALMDAADDGDD